MSPRHRWALWAMPWKTEQEALFVERVSVRANGLEERRPADAEVSVRASHCTSDSHASTPQSAPESHARVNAPTVLPVVPMVRIVRHRLPCIVQDGVFVGAPCRRDALEHGLRAAMGCVSEALLNAQRSQVLIAEVVLHLAEVVLAVE